MVVITHGDGDGIISASFYLKARDLKKETIYFTSPASLKDALCRAMFRRNPKELFIFDLSGNRQTIRLASAWERVTWIDHHEWEPEERFENVEFVVKRSLSAAQIVAEYFNLDSKLIEIANEIDTNSVKSEEAKYLRSLIGAIKWKYSKDQRVLANRLRALCFFLAFKDFSLLFRYENQKLVREYEAYLEKSLEAVLKGLKVEEVNGYKVAVCELTRFLPIYYITNNLLSHNEAPFDIIGVLVHSATKNNLVTKIELRSHTGKNVLNIAKRLNGGGHINAAGASVPEFFNHERFLEEVRKNLNV